MYDRRYEDKVLSFEPSGGLLNAALVMRDKETDSWWSIMTGNAIGGELKGMPLVELAAGEKTMWKDWKSRYPKTKVLSVDGKEHSEHNPYDRYFTSSEGFRGLETEDKRLPGKEPIYAFTVDGVSYAATHATIEGGIVFEVGEAKEVFLYRAPGASVYASTSAYVSDIEGTTGRIKRIDGKWLDTKTGAEFAQGTGFPAGVVGGESIERPPDERPLSRLKGFDTFWYIWSRTHENVRLIAPE